VLEGYTTEDQLLFCVFFLWAKDSIQRFIEKCFLFTVCCVNRFSLCDKRLTDDEEVETEVWKFLYAAGFDALVKQWDTCINIYEVMSRNKCPSRFEYHIFYYLLYCQTSYIHL
jgi:hypothetical protein